MLLEYIWYPYYLYLRGKKISKSQKKSVVCSLRLNRGSVQDFSFPPSTLHWHKPTSCHGLMGLVTHCSDITTTLRWTESECVSSLKKKTGAEILADVETSPAFVTTEAHFHLRPRFPHLTYAQTHSHQLSTTTVENKTGGALHPFNISRHFKHYRTALQCIDGNTNRFRLLSSSNGSPKCPYTHHLKHTVNKNRKCLFAFLEIQNFYQSAKLC